MPDASRYDSAEPQVQRVARFQGHDLLVTVWADGTLEVSPTTNGHIYPPLPLREVS